MSDANKKLVPESDLIAVKMALKKTQGELAQARAKVGELESDISVLGLDDSEEGNISAVKKTLLKQSKELATAKAKFEQERSEFLGREKSVRVRELVTQNQLDADVIASLETLESTEAIEKEIYRLKAEKLEAQIKSGNPPPTGDQSAKVGEGLYERGSGSAVVKKQPKDMTDDEFKSFLAGEEAKAASRR